MWKVPYEGLESVESNSGGRSSSGLDSMPVLKTDEIRDKESGTGSWEKFGQRSSGR